ncbi:hypothetical protein M514_10265 [Trichuris suis]|uniref:Uncharacterized protein n=1 Tax=Trichuris suis TaxID=68888 RepID=A0A085N9Q1_9BILA|nr:hypothetical protein M513_10265 [Trichuris suis]KFD66197.1 hypothetical protein M514_10265 [Trichuris suis]
MITSSRYETARGIPVSIVSITFWKIDGADFTPIEGKPILLEQPLVRIYHDDFLGLVVEL